MNIKIGDVWAWRHDNTHVHIPSRDKIVITDIVVKLDSEDNPIIHYVDMVGEHTWSWYNWFIVNYVKVE